MPVSKPKPFKVFGPGAVVKRETEALGWTQEDLSDILNLSPKSVSQIINNKQAITIETAVLLGKAFDSSPEFWMNLEQNYRLRLKETEVPGRETEAKARIRKYMPLADMRRKGWVDYGRSAASQIKAFSEFWAKETPDFSMYTNKAAPFYARRSGEDEEFTRYYTQTWLRKARMEADPIAVGKFSPEKLEELAKKIPVFTRQSEGIRSIIEHLNSAGVKFMILAHLEKTYLDGATFLSNRNPVIVYTGRHKNIDSFWWTLTHEIAHVLLHMRSASDCFIDNIDEDTAGNHVETEADNFCRDIMNVNAIISAAAPYRRYFTEDHLQELSEKYGLAPAMILGILQFNKVVTYRTGLNRLKSSVLDEIPEVFFR